MVGRVERLIEIWQRSRPLGQLGEGTRRELEKAAECLRKRASSGNCEDEEEESETPLLSPSFTVSPSTTTTDAAEGEDGLNDLLKALKAAEKNISFAISGERPGEITKYVLKYPEACEAVADSIHAGLQRYDVEVGFPARWSEQSAR
ncbi:hypothetical protein PG987_012123 [Apiospora arundinis]